MIPRDLALNVIDGPTLERIHRDTIQVLTEAGVVFDSDEILTVFKKKGARTDGRKVLITEAMVSAALESCPRSFTMVGRGKGANVQIGEGQDRMVISPGNGTLYILEMDGRRRPATLDDFHTITQLCEQSRHVHLVGSIPVEPCDLPTQSRPARLVHSLMQYSQKPLIGVAATRPEAREVFEVIEMAFGQPGFLDDHVAIAYSVNPASPLCFDSIGCGTLAAYANRGQALFILPGLMAGVSGPLDLIGLVVLSNAEILAALVCAQLIKPGTPVVYSPGTFMVNMQDLYTVTASPLGNLANLAGLQMAREYYHLPSRTMGGLTDAKQVDFQAGAETMQNLVLYTLAGANIINECLGVMDSIMVTSFEKWILDEELLARTHCLEKGLGQLGSPDPVANIKSVGSGGSYLMNDDTMENCRKVWIPDLSHWSPHETWENNGSMEIVQKAHQHFKERISPGPTLMLSPDIDAGIARYLQY